jgi:hypothetical protein
VTSAYRHASFHSLAKSSAKLTRYLTAAQKLDNWLRRRVDDPDLHPAYRRTEPLALAEKQENRGGKMIASGLIKEKHGCFSYLYKLVSEAGYVDHRRLQGTPPGPQHSFAVLQVVIRWNIVYECANPLG